MLHVELPPWTLVFFDDTNEKIKYAICTHVKMCDHVEGDRYNIPCRHPLVHVTVMFMLCGIACDPECWKSVTQQSTQSELEGL